MRTTTRRPHPGWGLCLLLAITACSGTDTATSTTATPTAAGTGGPGTNVGTVTSVPLPLDAPIADRLIAGYQQPGIDPPATTWRDLAASPTFATDPITVFELVRLVDTPGAKARYDRYLAALAPSVATVGGTVLGINDSLFPGLGEPKGYEGGASWIASFPSAKAFADALLAPDVVAVAGERRAAVAEAQVVAGPNLIPAAILALPPQEPAASYPMSQVEGRTPTEIVDELLQVYPDGGADPSRATLERIVTLEGFRDQRVGFLNLYQFNDDPGGGAASLNEYNAQALPYVLAHGARPKAIVDISVHLVGPIAWNRIIYVQWPSLAVFTDLRLDPGYLAAQTHRVASATRYGNLIGVPRPDPSPDQ